MVVDRLSTSDDVGSGFFYGARSGIGVRAPGFDFGYKGIGRSLHCRGTGPDAAGVNIETEWCLLLAAVFRLPRITVQFPIGNADLRFHVLQEFDEGKRSCRRRLADHNRRRRKMHPDNLPTAGSLNDERNNSFC